MSKQKDTLHLILKKQWFDMIKDGIKKEEYRAITDYWSPRLSYNGYKYIIFSHGYSKDRAQIKLECLGIEKGFAKPEWSGNWQGVVFIIKLGDIIK